MKIVLLSGGSGNDSLVKGLKSFYPDSDVKVIVNAYDNGKSTGVCRKVTGTLGVSDIRKNHIRMYKATKKDVDVRLVEFYENRYDFKSPREEIGELLFKWGLSKLFQYADRFLEAANGMGMSEFKDFNVSNIVYSQMYKEIGYEKTNSFFCNLLGIDDFVILNSFDNVFIKALTKSGICIPDEGEIVKYNNAEDPIEDIVFAKGNDSEISAGLNERALNLISDCDLLVISTGTFWSSIYPTLKYLDLYKVINASKAKKVWALNNEYDGDSYGVGAYDFARFMERLGIDLDDFTILSNIDAREDMQMGSKGKYNVIEAAMGNSNGKHDGTLFAKELLKSYYNLHERYDFLLVDFDDTIWSRAESKDAEELAVSKRNLESISKLCNCFVVSGGNLSHIHDKVYKTFGTKVPRRLKVWGNANSILEIGGKAKDTVPENVLSNGEGIAEFIESEFGLKPFEVNEGVVKYKPLSELERHLLEKYLNDYAFKNALDRDDAVARCTGVTTLDILSASNSKANTFKHMVSSGMISGRILYIGDEIDYGNDADISRLCNHSIHTCGVHETEVVLKLLEDCI